MGRFGPGTIILHFSIIFPLEKDLNSIWELCDGSGNVVKTQEDLQVLAKAHFSDQFKDPCQYKIDAQLKVISHLPIFFSPEESEVIGAPISLNEVKEVLKKFVKEKSVGLDG